MKLSVIGCGYLGVVHAAAMAELGHQVIGIDVNSDRVSQLQRQQAPFYEPGLPEILKSASATGRLRFSSDMAAISDATVHFIAVGTPQHIDGTSADLSFVDSAIAEMLPYLHANDLVVGKSTVPVGTAERIAELIKPTGARLAWNPEFLREGFAVQDSMSPDRLVYGLYSSGSDPSSGQPAKAILDHVYAATLATGTPLVVTDYATAELVKVAANAFLATKISFINAMAEIAEVVNADVTELADAIGYDARIGRNFLNAGIGFGGGCLPKDIRAFASRANELGRGESVQFLKEVDAINLRRRQRGAEMVLDALGAEPAGKKVAVLGLAFKPNSDDVRDSPALDIAVQLHRRGVQVVATDPEAIHNARSLQPQLEYVASTKDALANADAVLLVTEWAEYRALDPVWAADLVKERIIIDGRNCLNAEDWRSAGWDYSGMGRPRTAKDLTIEDLDIVNVA